MGHRLIRIVSDVHFGERSSTVRELGQLRPLVEGADLFVLNGDTLDTRPGGNAARTDRLRREVLGFFASCGMPVTFLTGNHDPDLDGRHSWNSRAAGCWSPTATSLREHRPLVQ